MTQATPVYDNDSGECIGQLQPTVSDDVLQASPGIQSWSKGERPACYILSVFREGALVSENEANHTYALAYLKARGVPCGEVLGCYKGLEEKSILVAPRGHGDAMDVITVARDADQESILLIDRNRNASLIYLDNPRAKLVGKLTEVSERVARRQDAWTYVPKLDTFYICK